MNPVHPFHRRYPLRVCSTCGMDPQRIRTLDQILEALEKCSRCWTDVQLYDYSDGPGLAALTVAWHMQPSDGRWKGLLAFFGLPPLPC